MRPWLGIALLVGAIYFAVSMATGALAAAASSQQSRILWRWSAFVICAGVFAAHIASEHFRLHSAARTAAWHASLAAALGGFALALAANIHELGSASGYRPRMLVALVAWPVITAVPAFLLALAAAAGLGVKRPRE